jgi:hypothetical protein
LEWNHALSGWSVWNGSTDISSATPFGMEQRILWPVYLRWE